MGLDRMGQKGMGELRARWETFDHGADIGIRGFGHSMEEAFENAALALFSIVVEDLSKVKPEKETKIYCSSFDLVGLFVAWINELLAQADIKEMVFCKFTALIEGVHLHGTATGQGWRDCMVERGIEVKGATFTEARVEQKNGLWIAQCVVDV